MKLGICMLLGLVSSNWAFSQKNSILTYTKLTHEQIKHLQSKGFGPTVPTVFKTNTLNEQGNEGTETDEEISAAESQAARGNDYHSMNLTPMQMSISKYPANPQPMVYRRPAQQKHHYVQMQTSYVQQEVSDKQQQSRKHADVKIEESEPDKLSYLLANSRFDCIGKRTGYYADEDLQCEVFHYCQGIAKHSWICPENFTFHQVHMICMPPGSDNICAKSAQFHFVNDYLYKPINLEEIQKKPYISLKYSDRFYPKNYMTQSFYEDKEDNDNDPHQQNRPFRVALQHNPQPQPQSLESMKQVFRSPEEVNISLQERKPHYVSQRYRDEYVATRF